MRLVVDTGVVSAALSIRRRRLLEREVSMMAGHQILLAAVTVSELRFGALNSNWGESRRARLERAIAATTVVPVTDALLTVAAELRYACTRAGHALAAKVHANDLWIAASALHVGAPLLTADGVFRDAPGLRLL